MRYLLPILIFFSGCSASYHIKKGFKKNPVLMAKVTRDSFPCLIGKVTGTDSSGYKQLLKYVDSLKKLDPIYEKVPEYIPIYEDTLFCIELLKIVDTLKKSVASKDKKLKELYKVIANAKPIIDTVPVADSAAIFLAQKETAKERRDKEKAQSEGEKWKGKAQRRGNANLWFVATILGLIAAIVLLIRSKLK